MHASIWKFEGDPGDLLVRYEAMLADVSPTAMRLHLCLRAPDGILLVDTCPTQEIAEAFVADAGLRELRERHGLPEPDRLEQFPVHVAIVEGQAVN